MNLVNANGLNLYWIDQKQNLITDKQTNIREYESCMPPNANHKYLATLAVERQQIIVVKDVDNLFETNPEITMTFSASSIICVPIMTSERKALLVIEIYKTEGEPFPQKAISYIQEFSKWFAIWLSQRFKYNEEANATNYRKKLEEMLLEYVNETYSYENILTRFMKNAKNHIKADKYFFYDYNIHTGFRNLYELIGEELLNTATRLKSYKYETFFYKVRDEKKPLVVQIENGCKQLDKEIELDPTNPIQCLLYYPILFGNRFLGILVFGKTGGENCDFSEDDKLEVSKMVSVLADVLVYRYIMEEKERRAARTEIYRETFINLLRARLRPQLSISGTTVAPHQIHRLSWELVDLNDPDQLSYLCKMFQNTYHFDWDRLKIFLLCAQIAHNDYPYHNMKTTFHIVRTVYCIIQKLDTKLKPYEKAALLIAAVSYYCGHNMLDNHVMLKVKHPLTKIYKTYMKENHRIWMLKLLLDQTKLLNGNKESDIIISTANTLLLKSKKYESKDFRHKISNMLDTETFNIKHETIRIYILLAILRIGVHGRHMQPFNVAKKLRDYYYEEILILGDLERKEGFNLGERKNRERRFSISHLEIDYIKNSVLTTLGILSRIFPETSVWMVMPKDVLKAHEILVGSGNKKLWDPELCVDIGRTR